MMADIKGEVADQHAVMRPLGLDDLDALQDFIEAMPESHLAIRVYGGVSGNKIDQWMVSCMLR